MTVRVEDERLNRPIRPQLRFRKKRHTGRFQFGRGLHRIIDREGKMVAARCFRATILVDTRRAGTVVLENEVDQRFASLKPGAGEVERWPRHFGHAEQFDVKPAARAKVANDERDVIDLLDAEHGKCGLKGRYVVLEADV